MYPFQSQQDAITMIICNGIMFIACTVLYLRFTKDLLMLTFAILFLAVTLISLADMTITIEKVNKSNMRID